MPGFQTSQSIYLYIILAPKRISSLSWDSCERVAKIEERWQTSTQPATILAHFVVAASEE